MGILGYKKTVKILYYTRPIGSERIEIEAKVGHKLSEYIKDPAIFVVNDHYKTADYKIKKGDIISARALPTGGDVGDTTKLVGGLMMLAGGVLLLTGVGSVFGASLLISGASTFVAGMGIKQGWFLPDLPDLSSGFGGESRKAMPQIRGGRNQFNPYGAIPIVLGRHLVVPPYGGKPFTQNGGKAIRQLFVLGYSPLKITKIRIKDTDIVNLGSGITGDYDEYVNAPYSCNVEVRQGSTPIRSTYFNQVSEEIVNSEMSYGIPIIRSTADETDTIEVVYVAPLGFFSYNSKGDRRAAYVLIRTEVKPYGAPDSSYEIAEEKTWSYNSTEPISKTVRIKKSRGKYTVRVTRLTQEPTDGKTLDKVYLWSVSSIKNEDSIDTTLAPKLTRLGLAVYADERLSGFVDEVNCEVESICPAWNGLGSGSAYWQDAPTRNPAALYLYLLRGWFNPDPVPDANIDWPAFEEWYSFCATKGFSCDMVVTDQKPLIDLLKVVAATGRASPAWKDGKYSILIEKERTTPVQMFTPRNSWGFSGSKAFAQIPHALKIRYIDASLGYQEAECIVYDDGYNAGNATVFETLTMPGVTSYQHAWKLGRYRIAEARLRPEVYTLSADIEAIRCTRGDRVLVQHDVMLVGLQSARIKEVYESGGSVTGVKLDDYVTMVAGKTYVLRYRTKYGGIELKTVNTIVGETYVVTFETPISSNKPSVGDLCVFGESGKETLDCLVLSMQMEKDFAAKLTLVPYAEAVYTADSGTIPSFDPKITAPYEDQLQPPQPVVINARSDGTTLLLQQDGTWINRILITLAQVGGFTTCDQLEVRYYPIEDDEAVGDEQVLYVPASQLWVSLSPVEPERIYKIRLRYVNSVTGKAGKVTEITHTVIGMNLPPQDVPSAQYFVRSNGVEIVWSQVEDKDIKEYILKVGTQWSTAQELYRGGATRYLWEHKTAGTYHILIKAFDTTGHESVNAYDLTVTIQAPGAVQNLQASTVGNSVYVAWTPPATGTFPISQYEIRKGATWSGGTVIGKTGGTFFEITEADLGTYKYWIAAIDVAGNYGEESSINAVVQSIAIAGSETSLVIPVIDAKAYVGAISVRVLNVPINLAYKHLYHIQVSDDQSNWYEPRLDGVDWKGTIDGYASFEGGGFLHTNIPNGGTEEEPTGRTLYYRVRLYANGTQTSWSATVSATTRPIGKGDILAGSITAEKTDVAELSAISANLGTITDGALSPDGYENNYWVLSDGIVQGKNAGDFRIGNQNSFIRFIASTGELLMKLVSFLVSSLVTRVKGVLEISDEGDIEAGLTKPLKLSADGAGNARVRIGDNEANLVLSGNGSGGTYIRRYGYNNALLIDEVAKVPIYYNKYMIGGWGAPSQITSSQTLHTRVCLLPSGELLAVYTDSGYNIKQRIRSSGGSWGSETTIGSNGRWLDICLLPSGEVLLVFRRSSDGYIVQRIRSTGGSWGSESVIVSSSISGYIRIAMMPDNKVLMVYQKNDYYIYERIRDSNGTWGGETQKTAVSSYVLGMCKLANGTHLILYMNGSVTKLYMVIRATNGTWGTPTTVHEGLCYDAEPCLLPTGEVLILYSIYSDYSVVQRVYANGLLPASTLGVQGYASAMVLLSDGSVLWLNSRVSDGYCFQRIMQPSVNQIGTVFEQLGAGIVEEGQNSNGSWIKFSSGVLVCWGNISTVTGGWNGSPSGLHYQNFSITYPVSFVNGNHLSFAWIRIPGHTVASMARNDSNTATGTTCSPLVAISDGVPSGVTTYIHWMALGRWK